MGARERSKGQRGENELAALLSDELGISIKRMLGQERDGGADLHVGPLRIQVKRCETIKIAEWWRQACADAAGGIPVLAYRASRRPWTIRMTLGELMGQMDGISSEWVELPLNSFVIWVRENVDLRQPDA